LTSGHPMRLIARDSNKYSRRPEARNHNNIGALLISPLRLSHKPRPPLKSINVYCTRIRNRLVFSQAA
jgi:hypothetical protein